MSHTTPNILHLLFRECGWVTRNVWAHMSFCSFVRKKISDLFIMKSQSNSIEIETREFRRLYLLYLFCRLSFNKNRKSEQRSVHIRFEIEFNRNWKGGNIGCMKKWCVLNIQHKWFGGFVEWTGKCNSFVSVGQTWNIITTSSGQKWILLPQHLLESVYYYPRPWSTCQSMQMEYSSSSFKFCLYKKKNSFVRESFIL